MCTVNVILVALFAFGRIAFADDPYFEPNTWHNRGIIVQLLEWKWADIAKECEEFLAPHGFAAVQTSPPTENVIVYHHNQRPWYERYQPISYKLITRSGNEEEFADMARRCNKVGVRIYIDLVINHMTSNSEINLGTGGSTCDSGQKSYPAVPYDASHFHESCSLQNEEFNDAIKCRNCELVGLHDLDHSQDYVRDKIIELMNHLIELGVAGVRVDAAKHMWPYDLKYMIQHTIDLKTEYGFPEKSRLFAYLEVIDRGDSAIPYTEYTDIGRIIDFKYSSEMKRVFSGYNELHHLQFWGNDWKGLVFGPISVVFIDNHDTQREGNSLTYKDSRRYKMANAVMLAHPHGFPRVMSSYDFKDKDDGPPTIPGTELLLSPEFDPATGACTNGYICEHRWRQIKNMVAFRVSAGTTPVDHWWDNGGDMIAFGRGGRAFIAINNQYETEMNIVLPTGMMPGEYCDIISGDIINNACTGNVIEIDPEGKGRFVISPLDSDGVLAIHVGSRIRDSKL